MSTHPDLHQTLLTIDSHIDIPWPDPGNFFDESPRKVDLPKMRRGGMVAACLVAYVPQTPRNPDTNQASFDRACAMLRAINALGGNQVRICTSADAIEAANRDGTSIIIPAVENGQALGGDVGRLQTFYDLGARYLTLTHFGHNALGDSSNPRADLGDPDQEHGGLSEMGRQVVAELNRLGMLVDIAHTSKNTMLQAAALSRTPVLSTQSCIRAICDNARNLDDEQLDVLGAVGGVVQITAVPSFLKKGAKASEVTVADYVDHIDYAVRRIGVEHVGISSDFDGGGGFTGWHDAADSANLTTELQRRGYGPSQRAALWGGNFMRLLRLAETRAG